MTAPFLAYQFRVGLRNVSSILAFGIPDVNNLLSFFLIFALILG